MQNLVQKHITEAPEANDEGVVAIEYVLVAVAVSLGVGVVFATGTATSIWTKMNTTLNGLF
jgi:hypothetical protein